MENIINWGIVGCGSIAREFAEALKYVDGAKLIAVASKSGKEKEFAADFNVQYHFNNYDDFVRNEDVHVVYIATTHNFHYENTMLCLNNNKHVLCEKPFALNVKQSKKLIETAKQKKLFLMEAMWTRFAPALKKLISILKKGVIGDIQMLKGDFCIDTPFDPKHRIYNPDLAGGALLDVGIYPITFSCMILEKYPVRVISKLNICETGVDKQSYYMLEFDKGETAMLSSAVNYHAPIDFYVYGTKGYIHIPKFYFPSKLIVNYYDNNSETIEIPYISTGKNYEAMEVIECLRNSKLESDVQTHAATLRIMEIMDEIRGEELKYPGEDDF